MKTKYLTLTHGNKTLYWSDKYKQWREAKGIIRWWVTRGHIYFHK